MKVWSVQNINLKFEENFQHFSLERKWKFVSTVGSKKSVSKLSIYNKPKQEFWKKLKQFSFLFFFLWTWIQCHSRNDFHVSTFFKFLYSEYKPNDKKLQVAKKSNQSLSFHKFSEMNISEIF